MFNLPKIEEEVLEFWKKDRTFQKSLDKESPQGDYVFYEGPPTANGRPGIHHVLARAFKDLIPRYKTMQGYHVIRKAGWDTHGLPVEIEVEKKLGLKNKQEIEEYGIAKFNEEAKKSVWEYKDEWEKLSEKIGYWVDLKDPYITYDKNYIETLWWIIKQWYEKDLLYEGHKVVPHCPRCGTALSSHEVAQGYETVKDRSVYIKFKVRGGNTYLLSWTTTPWTLPGNVGLAINKNMKYAKVRVKTPEGAEEWYILAEALLEKTKNKLEPLGYKFSTNYEDISTKDILSLSYDSLFPQAIPESTDDYQKAFKVYHGDFVTIEDGTGVVHTAVMYGDDDYKLGDEIGLPKHHTVSIDGKFDFPETNEEILKELHGKPVKHKDRPTENQTTDTIINYLKKNNLLLLEEEYEHEYPFCWRCKTPLLYYAKNSWFVAVSKCQDKLLKNAKEINWVPGHIKEGRFGNWLEGIKDWAFSRERYWGTPLPVWKCSSESCQNIHVIGSYEELEELSSKKIDDPHRPFIDEVEFKCDKCGGEMHRVLDVCDVWFDSGAMPLAQYHYPFENKDLIDEGKQYPANYICEGLDQTRGWFYTLLAVATLLDRPAPYKNVITIGMMLDKQGKKMSKSLGNIVSPWDMQEKYGADAMRWYFYTSTTPGEPKRFDEQGLKESSRMFITLLNVVNIYKMYAPEKVEDLNENDLVNVLDIWVNARLNNLLQNVTNKLNSYDITSASKSINEFINELSTWYVRRSRDRFKGDDEEDKLRAIKTLKYVIFNLVKLMAPFTPFTAEHIYTNEMKGKGGSVHLHQWPEANQADRQDDKVIEKMQLTRQIVEMGLAKRDEEKIPVRQPLNKLKVKSCKLKVEEEYIKLIKDELNIKNIEIEVGEGEMQGELDTEITEELKLEGMKRDLVRQINNLRKKQGLTIQDKVKLGISTDSVDIKKVIDLYGDDILQATLASEFVAVPYEASAKEEISDEAEELKISGEEVKVSLSK